MLAALWVQRSGTRVLPVDMEVADTPHVVLCGIALTRAPVDGTQGMPAVAGRQQAKYLRPTPLLRTADLLPSLN